MTLRRTRALEDTKCSRCGAIIRADAECFCDDENMDALSCFPSCIQNRIRPDGPGTGARGSESRVDQFGQKGLPRVRPRAPDTSTEETKDGRKR